MTKPNLSQLSGDPAQAAEELAQARFRLADLDHPATRYLFDAAKARIEETLTRAPEAMEDLTPPPPAPRPASPDDAPDFSAPRRPVKDINPPPLPQVFIALQRASQDPSASLKQVADIISHDPGLSSFLLRLANSAFYSFPGGVDSVFRAVQLIGMREIINMAAAKAVSGLFKESPRKDLLEIERFWRHSVACALMARALCVRAGRPDPDRLFVAGLLHDVGKVLLVISEPDMYEASLARSRTQAMPMYLSEKSILGFDHADLGGSVLERWTLPQKLCEAARLHHDPSLDADGAGADLVHVADLTAIALGLGTRPDCPVPPLDAKAWNGLGLSPEDLGLVIADCDEKLDSLRDVLLGKEKPEPSVNVRQRPR